MDIHQQDKKYLKASFIIVALSVIVLGFLDVEPFKLLIIAPVLMLTAILIYWMQRKHIFLVGLMKNYTKNRKVPRDIEMAIVKAAYGKYRLGLVTFKAELLKNPNDQELIKIVSQFEQLIKK